MRIVVTGVKGQVASSLLERAKARCDIVALGRPDLDLADRDSVLRALEAAQADAIVNAAAYTAVDKAEQEETLAFRVNAEGAAHVAEAAARIGAPLLQFSTDYVFDGALKRPYVETDQTNPTGAYGRSKLEGDKRVRAAQPDSVVLRTAWVYSPFGANFVRTMLRLGETREEVGVVADQLGNPSSALDIADALIALAERLVSDRSADLRGVFHMAGQGEASWADLAEATFAAAERSGRKLVRVKRITTADYPTPAKRPANSRLDCGKLERVFGVALPPWRASLETTVARLLTGA
ncbi:MAG: dTDP-4-dehydrorhamnose reductase [Methylocystis sp.]